jgi:phospholipase C
LKKSEAERKLEQIIAELKNDWEQYKPENFAKLSQTEKNLHEKAFTTNSNDPDYWNLEIGQDENGERLVIPKGDVLYQFRKDVNEKITVGFLADCSRTFFRSSRFALVWSVVYF